MAKALSISGMIVASLVVLLFGADLAVGFPFQNASGMMFDLIFIACAGILGYMSWNAFRELK